MKSTTPRKKTVVLILSRHYPKTTLHAGKPTHFKEQLLDGRKIHTCRSSLEGWVHKIHKVNTQNYVLSVREWEGRPYGKDVRQKEITKYDEVGFQRLTMWYNRDTDNLTCIIDGKRFMDVEQLARNDGMTLAEFKDWFFGQYKGRDIYNGIIIHFTKFRYI